MIPGEPEEWTMPTYSALDSMLKQYDGADRVPNAAFRALGESCDRCILQTDHDAQDPDDSNLRHEQVNTHAALSSQLVYVDEGDQSTWMILDSAGQRAVHGAEWERRLL